MTMQCAIAGYSVNAHAARVVGFIAFAGAVAILLLPAPLALALALVLAVDFALRGFARPSASPLGRLANAVLARAGVAPLPVDAGPKRFAAQLGLGMLVAIAALFAVGLDLPARGLALALALCAGLEAGAGLCVGCYLYSWIVAPLRGGAR